MTPTARTINAWYKTHKWTSLICTVFLLMSCITGLPLIFGEEIYHLSGHAKPADLPADAPVANIDELVVLAKSFYPSEQILSVGWDDDEPRLFVNTALNSDPKPEEEHTVIFDVHTGKMLEKPGNEADWMDILFRLHTEIYAGLPGELFLGLMALLFTISLVSGAVIYGPFMRKLDFGTLRKALTTRVKWFDLHNLVGIVTLAWALAVGTTGVMNTLADPLFGLWQAQAMPPLLAPYAGKPMPARLSSARAAVEVARKALPASEITSIMFPNSHFGSPRHYLIWARGRTPITSQLFNAILVDAESGELSRVAGLPWYLRLLEISRPLHFGDYGGIFLKILWAIFDLALIIVLSSGLYLWFTRRRKLLEGELEALGVLERAGA